MGARLCVAVLAFWVVGVAPVLGGEVAVAVASNFVKTMAALSFSFESQTGHRLVLSSGSTGKLFAQIVNGAPFDVYLAANSREPERLERQGRAVAGSRFTYAQGRLVFWAGGERVDPTVIADRVCGTARFAIANPKTAPYGVAAMQVIDNLGCADTVSGRLVRGENIAQTYQFVATRNVAFGFVARSQLGPAPAASFWVVPEVMHDPIAQQAVLLTQGAKNVAAQEFMRFLASDTARQIVCQFGYGAPGCD